MSKPPWLLESGAKWQWKNCFKTGFMANFHVCAYKTIFASRYEFFSQSIALNFDATIPAFSLKQDVSVMRPTPGSNCCFRDFAFYCSSRSFHWYCCLKTLCKIAQKAEHAASHMEKSPQVTHGSSLFQSFAEIGRKIYFRLNVVWPETHSKNSRLQRNDDVICFSSGFLYHGWAGRL